MNRYVKIFGLAVLVGMVALVGGAAAFAQSAAPAALAGGCGGTMRGIMTEYRDQIHARVAEALGLTVEEFDAALAAGQTPFALAQEKGVDLQAVMQAAHAEILKQAVADGKLTQAQADAITQRHAQMGARHPYGSGPMMGRSGR